MSTFTFILITSFFLTVIGQSHWINEIHYIDNSLPKGVEIAGEAYVDLTDWSIEISSGSVTSTHLISSPTIENEAGGYGAIWEEINLPSNGAVAITLLDGTGAPIDSISYGGPVTTLHGAARQILIQEDPSSTSITLQLTGLGVDPLALTWEHSVHRTTGGINVNQALITNCIDAPLSETWYETSPQYNCDWYAERGNCGLFYADTIGVQGLSANQACCICGGGITLAPTKTPTSPPTNSPTESPSFGPSMAPTLPIPVYEQQLEACQEQASQYQTLLDDYHDTVEMCEIMGVSIVCSHAPTALPTSSIPSQIPSSSPEVSVPTKTPSASPESAVPTKTPSDAPQSSSPTDAPTDGPTAAPHSSSPTGTPSDAPVTSVPTKDPTASPHSSAPTDSPSSAPSQRPSVFIQPTKTPTFSPTTSPSDAPFTSDPSMAPTITVRDPTNSPSMGPTHNPSLAPQVFPTKTPTKAPTCECVDIRPPDAPGGVWFDNPGVGGARFTCELYGTIPGFCDEFGASEVNYGYNANQACCVCGGGSCGLPSRTPTVSPSNPPVTSIPSLSPSTSQPSFVPTLSPDTSSPSNSPSLSPSTPLPSKSPVTSDPSQSPSAYPTTSMPTLSPVTSEPTHLPTEQPTFSRPTVKPTNAPSDNPTLAPDTSSPSMAPSVVPTPLPTVSPTTSSPSNFPTTSDPSVAPTQNPTDTRVHCVDFVPEDAGVDRWFDSNQLLYDCKWYENRESACALFGPVYTFFGMNALQACCICGGGITAEPTLHPSELPTEPAPTPYPSTTEPTDLPSTSPFTSEPSLQPTDLPTQDPTGNPTFSDPSAVPTQTPSMSPDTSSPTNDPTMSPSISSPSQTPTKAPATSSPTRLPSTSPQTSIPTKTPTHGPTNIPTLHPTFGPSVSPTCQCHNLRPPEAPNGLWFDSSGDRYDCRFYEYYTDLCATEGGTHTQFGLNAQQACCACGGGSCDTPSRSPTQTPTGLPTDAPTTSMPSLAPTTSPTISSPTTHPSLSPTTSTPSFSPTASPVTSVPSVRPTFAPSLSPFTSDPSQVPTESPVTSEPSMPPTDAPTVPHPTPSPTDAPVTSNPSNLPSTSPLTSDPSAAPTDLPSVSPTLRVHCTDFVPEDSPLGKWYDGQSDSNEADCDWYAWMKSVGRDLCDHFDTSTYANFDKTAKQACCVCGGGVTSEPTHAPSDMPVTSLPSKCPSLNPARYPTILPTLQPSDGPQTAQPSKSPHKVPTDSPTTSPTNIPSSSPSDAPVTSDPTKSPTDSPVTSEPTENPTGAPVTSEPTNDPTNTPTDGPTDAPTLSPETSEPSNPPTPAPVTSDPTASPSEYPTEADPMPTVSPVTSEPTECVCFDLAPASAPGNVWHDDGGTRFSCSFYALDPEQFCDNGDAWPNYGYTAKQACCACGGGSCDVPTHAPTFNPSDAPTKGPTAAPTTSSPSFMPTDLPTFAPSMLPTSLPTELPTLDPTTSNPTASPTDAPVTSSPTPMPTLNPVTSSPTFAPSVTPTTSEPTSPPSLLPSMSPLDQTCEERVADVLASTSTCESNLGSIQASLTSCEANTIDDSTYDALLEDISDCESSVASLQEELDLLSNGALSVCTDSVYVEVFRNDYSFFNGVYFQTVHVDSSSYVAINNDAETILKHNTDGTWILSDTTTSLTTPHVLSGVYPPSLEHWEDPEGLYVIVRIGCHEPQVVSDCGCDVSDHEEETLNTFSVSCATLAPLCNHPDQGSLVTQFCPATCGTTSWGTTLFDNNAALKTYGSQIAGYPTECRDPSVYCEFMDDVAYGVLCPVATAECKDITEVCDMVCSGRRMLQTQDVSTTCPFATVTVYHSQFKSLEGTYSLASADPVTFENNDVSLSYTAGVWDLNGALSTETDAAYPPESANWRSASGSIVIATVECATTANAMTYQQCEDDLATATQALDDCTKLNTQIDTDLQTCEDTCAEQQAAGAECEAAKAVAERRASSIAVDTVSEASEINWFHYNKFVNDGLDQALADNLMEYNNEFVYDNGDGTYTRTCVGYSTDASAACDGESLVCSGGGGSKFGYAGNMSPKIREALSQVNHIHPDCPTGCQTLTSWWQDNSDLEDVSRLCTIGDAFYFIEERDFVFTCVSIGDNDAECPNNNIVCAGTNSNGMKTYGWPSYQASLLNTALQESNKRYPHCPNY